ncbi:MAG: carbohydrate ABC transporter permease [Candidatus Cohnella colombiensis]|uniref:Carbohydrate ABC transporter permease n=1 Tax=Candidatus Cohnella colombiensis TaxID=3121368 RepID=A0AA95EXV0_9BACL|nr:MAG: carbohydrate ABC transporter permease [Cohnella sp.]
MNELKPINKAIYFIVGLIITVLFLFPIIWMISTSVKPVTELFAYPPKIIPSEFVFEAYVDNFVKSNKMLNYFGNSFIIAGGTMIFSLLVAAPSAYALTRLKVRGKGLILFLLLITQMMPTIMLAIPFFITFANIGLLNNYFSLILADATIAVPFAIMILRPFFQALPSELESAALIDGCGKFGTFTRVILPLVKPGLYTVGAFCFLYGWGDLLYSLILTTNESIRPITLGLYNFIGVYGTEWNSLMAVATIAMVPIILIFILIQKHIVSGLTTGAMKG